MSHRSQSGPVKVIGHVEKLQLTPEQQSALDSSRRAINASKQAEKLAYEEHLKLKGLRRL